MHTTLAHRPVDSSEWSVMREQAEILVSTGFLPTAIRKPEQAVAIMLKGRELGIPPMYALSNITVIQGKPVAGAELMLALLYRDHGDHAIRIVRSDAECCTIEYRRRAWTKPERYSFTIQDAKTAGLLGNQTWQKYPHAMLRARCISAVARMAFADSIGGLYTPEELGASVTVTDEGEIQTVAPAAPAYDREAHLGALRALREKLTSIGGTPAPLKGADVRTPEQIDERMMETQDEIDACLTAQFDAIVAGREVIAEAEAEYDIAPDHTTVALDDQLEPEHWPKEEATA